jgi:hypothetical protein
VKLNRGGIIVAKVQITKHPKREVIINDIPVPDVTDITIEADINGERVDTITLEIKIDKLEMELI